MSNGSGGGFDRGQRVGDGVQRCPAPGPQAGAPAGQPGQPGQAAGPGPAARPQAAGAPARDQRTYWIGIQLIDQDDVPIPDERYTLAQERGALSQEGQLDGLGSARLDNVRYSHDSFAATFPALSWLLVDFVAQRDERFPLPAGVEAVPRRNGSPSYDCDYEVQPGDCIASIAAGHGMVRNTIWNHARNAQLRASAGRDRYILNPGDRVYIPPLEPKEAHVLLPQKWHVFRVKREWTRLQVIVERLDKPRAGTPYTLELERSGGGRTWGAQGNTSSAGLVSQRIPPDATAGTLTVGTGAEQDLFRLLLGHIDPIDEIAGQQGRLGNLGYGPCACTGEQDKPTTEAMLFFEMAHAPRSLSGRDDRKTTVAHLEPNERKLLTKQYGC